MTDEFHYAIGKFPEENDAVAIVPLRWMKDDDYCYWPPIKSKVVALAKSATSDEAISFDGWSICQVKLLRYRYCTGNLFNYKSFFQCKL